MQDYLPQDEQNKAALQLANKELAIQEDDKQNRAAELLVAKKELAYQKKEKKNRAAELAIANTELIFQNQEKEKRAAELAQANLELTFQNKEKEARAAELLILNKQLESFTFISSHDLQEPLRKIQTFSSRLLAEEYDNLSSRGRHYVERMQASALHMQTLINDLLVYSRATETNRKFETNNLNTIIQEVIDSLNEEINEKLAVVEIQGSCTIDIITFQFRQLLQNLITNSLKFAKPGTPSHIIIKNSYIKNELIEGELVEKNKREYCEISFSDNGIGFAPKFNEHVFELFQRLNEKKDYEGTGIGLTIVKKIVQNHSGTIKAEGQLGVGCLFTIKLPIVQK